MTNNVHIEDFLANDISLFLVILSLTILGSYVKDIFSPRKNRTSKLRYGMTYSSAVVVAILIFAWSDMLMRYFSGKKFLAVCVLGGLVSVEITQKLTTISGIKRFLRDFLDFLQRSK